eukprot:6046029-Pyramimonas_sp.AAC.1
MSGTPLSLRRGISQRRDKGTHHHTRAQHAREKPNRPAMEEPDGTISGCTQYQAGCPIQRRQDMKRGRGIRRTWR